MREVGEERDVEPAEAALLARRVHPRQMCEVRVHRASNDLKHNFVCKRTIDTVSFKYGKIVVSSYSVSATFAYTTLTSAPSALNSETLSLKARISVGQTKVKSSG